MPFHSIVYAVPSQSTRDKMKNKNKMAPQEERDGNPFSDRHWTVPCQYQCLLFPQNTVDLNAKYGYSIVWIFTNIMIFHRHGQCQR